MKSCSRRKPAWIAKRISLRKRISVGEIQEKKHGEVKFGTLLLQEKSLILIEKTNKNKKKALKTFCFQGFLWLPLLDLNQRPAD